MAESQDTPQEEVLAAPETPTPKAKRKRPPNKGKLVKLVLEANVQAQLLYDHGAPVPNWMRSRRNGVTIERGTEIEVLESVANSLLAERTLSYREGMDDQYVPMFRRI